jgi:hypothetical protein
MADTESSVPRIRDGRTLTNLQEQPGTSSTTGAQGTGSRDQHGATLPSRRINNSEATRCAVCLGFNMRQS